jgi:protein-tyrosine phosphatase
MAAGEDALDASNIVPRLWVGGVPPFDRDMPAFDVLVLCARELQPECSLFHGLVIRCPIPDDALTTAEVSRTLTAARMVSDALLSGKRVLVTCAAGINRSVLVASLALHRITRMGSGDLIRIMRTRRHPNALYNRNFQDLLRTFTSRPTRRSDLRRVGQRTRRRS